MLSEKQLTLIRASFPPEALSADTSRGFELTSIKAAFVVERLNDVFGACGCGWRYVHAPFDHIEGEVVTEVALQFKVVEGGVNPVVWDTRASNWTFIEDGEAWSWPIYSPGGRRPGKGTCPITDARKGAITDGLTKAASMIGVGHEVFKGMVRMGATTQAAKAAAPAAQPVQPGVPASTEPPSSAKPNGQVAAKPSGEEQRHGASGNGRGENGAGSNRKPNGAGQANATTFWTLANQHTDKLDRAMVSALARQAQKGALTWREAEARLDDLIDAATIPTFGGSAERVHEAVMRGSTNSYAEKVADPLDELFA